MADMSLNTNTILRLVVRSIGFDLDIKNLNKRNGFVRYTSISKSLNIFNFTKRVIAVDGSPLLVVGFLPYGCRLATL